VKNKYEHENKGKLNLYQTRELWSKTNLKLHSVSCETQKSSYKI
jgi:hypothetical protein